MIPLSLTPFTLVYLLLVMAMAAFAFHKVKMLTLFFSRRVARPPEAEAGDVDRAPRVCVQCPVYNEPLVIDALLEAVAGIRWPEGRLEIQVLDDSSDATTALIVDWLARHPREAVKFQHVRRARREGYKAGALAHGVSLTDAEFFAIFDADFRPGADFLEALMPHFVAPDVAVVQARWEFANRHASLLTRFQALFLDAHFVVEQTARHTAGLFFNFNGTAGIWRRAALDAAGGWTSDTVTEDLDVSYRAQLLGWRFVYRGDYAVPSELPENISAFKSQQRRWTKGGVQVMRKQLGTILRSGVPARIKREATWHLSVGFIHPLLVAFAVMLVPYFLYVPMASGGSAGWLWFTQPVALVFTFWATIGLYVAGQQLRRGEWLRSLGVVVASPLILSFGLAMSVTNTVAVIEGLCQRGGEFVRTPKGGAGAEVGGLFERLRSRTLFLGITGVEAALGLVMAAGAVYFARLGMAGTALLLGVKASGFLGLAAVSLRDLRPGRAAVA